MQCRVVCRDVQRCAVLCSGVRCAVCWRVAVCSAGWCGVVRCGVVWDGVDWYGVVWSGVERCVGWCGVLWGGAECIASRCHAVQFVVCIAVAAVQFVVQLAVQCVFALQFGLLCSAVVRPPRSAVQCVAGSAAWCFAVQRAAAYCSVVQCSVQCCVVCCVQCCVWVSGGECVPGRARARACGAWEGEGM